MTEHTNSVALLAGGEVVGTEMYGTEKCMALWAWNVLNVLNSC